MKIIIFSFEKYLQGRFCVPCLYISIMHIFREREVAVDSETYKKQNIFC